MKDVRNFFIVNVRSTGLELRITWPLLLHECSFFLNFFLYFYFNMPYGLVKTLKVGQSCLSGC